MRKLWKYKILLAPLPVYIILLALGTIVVMLTHAGQSQPEGNAKIEIAKVSEIKANEVINPKTGEQKPALVCLTGDHNLGTMNEFFDRDLYVYEMIHAELQSCDLLIANLESNISEAASGAEAPKGYHFKAYPIVVTNQLQKLGVDAVSLANNHTMDYGPAAFIEEMNLLNAAGILQFGGGVDAADAFTPRYIDLNGTTIALLAFNSIENYVTDAGVSTAGSAYFDTERSLAAVRTARENADIVTVYAHWGYENNPATNDWQRSWARMFIDAGADIVWGSGPHLQQGEETYAGKPVYYSIGNFAVAGFSWLAGGTDGSILKLQIADKKIQSITRDTIGLDPNGWPY